MQKSYAVFMGVDVSKDKLDYCLLDTASLNTPQFGVVKNQEKAMEQWVAKIKKQVAGKPILVCLENTGVYSMPLCYCLQKNQVDYWVVAALEIKRSKGITRGKSDKTDARDIAHYALTHQHQVRLSTIPQKDIITLRTLLAEREKLIKALHLFGATQEMKGFLHKEAIQSVLQHNKKTVELLNKQLDKIESLIDETIAKNATFNQQNSLLQSIPGLGKQTAIMFIAYTQAFTVFEDHRQFACYAGIAPFEYASGSSIRGKTKVSPLANLKIKSLLTMAALAAKKYDTQMKAYYEKKVAEGKNKMSVLNAVRCKVVSRAFAVIHRNTPYVNTLKAVA